MYKIVILNGEETSYLIHDDGRLFNKKTNHFLKGSLTPSGYRNYQMTFKGRSYNFLAHRLVAEYFIENPDNLPVVHHKDGNRLNNHLNNLAWVSSSENLIEAYKNGRVNNQKKNYITEGELNNFEWRQIENTQYYVSEYGEVYNSNTKIKLKPKKDGYLRYTYYKNGETIIKAAHILVYENFVSKEIKYEIDHIDGNRFNNHYTNLRDVEHATNAINAMKNGHKNVIPVCQLNDNKEVIKTFPSIAAAAREMNCQPALIRRAINKSSKSHGFYWKEK